MTSKKLLGDGTHGPGLGKSPMEWRGGEGREEGRFGPSPMDEGRKGGRKEGEGRRSKKSVDIWEF